METADGSKVFCVFRQMLVKRRYFLGNLAQMDVSYPRSFPQIGFVPLAKSAGKHAKRLPPRPVSLPLEIPLSILLFAGEPFPAKSPIRCAGHFMAIIMMAPVFTLCRRKLACFLLNDRSQASDKPSSRTDIICFWHVKWRLLAPKISLAQSF